LIQPKSLSFASLLLAGILGSAAAQTSAPDSPQPANSQTQQKQAEDSQRVFGVVPLFSVTNQANATPLTPRQKFKLFERTGFDYFNFLSTGFQAALSQASNEFQQYGQGGEGYAKRYGATFADQASSNFFANFFYPVLLKEDPRYFRLGYGSAKKRIFNAVEQEFVARKDGGGKTFAFDNVLGAFSSGTLSNAYYPSHDRGLGLTVSRSLIAILYGSAGGLFSEFSPDIQRKLFHKKHKQSTP
jgi:hypothetical protein